MVFDSLQKVVENLDNLRRNNLKTERSKRGSGARKLERFLERFFTECLDSESNIEIKLKFAYRLRSFGKQRNNVMDVLVGFYDRPMKSLILDALWNKPKILVERQELNFPFRLNAL